jgi:hypothetical protein
LGKVSKLWLAFTITFFKKCTTLQHSVGKQADNDTIQEVAVAAKPCKTIHTVLNVGCASQHGVQKLPFQSHDLQAEQEQWTASHIINIWNYTNTVTPPKTCLKLYINEIFTIQNYKVHYQIDIFSNHSDIILLWQLNSVSSGTCNVSFIWFVLHKKTLGQYYETISNHRVIIPNILSSAMDSSQPFFLLLLVFFCKFKHSDNVKRSHSDHTHIMSTTVVEKRPSMKTEFLKAIEVTCMWAAIMPDGKCADRWFIT